MHGRPDRRATRRRRKRAARTRSRPVPPARVEHEADAHRDDRGRREPATTSSALSPASLSVLELAVRPTTSRNAANTWSGRPTRRAPARCPSARKLVEQASRRRSCAPATLLATRRARRRTRRMRPSASTSGTTTRRPRGSSAPRSGPGRRPGRRPSGARAPAPRSRAPAATRKSESDEDEARRPEPSGGDRRGTRARASTVSRRRAVARVGSARSRERPRLAAQAGGRQDGASVALRRTRVSRRSPAPPRRCPRRGRGHARSLVLAQPRHSGGESAIAGRRSTTTRPRRVVGEVLAHDELVGASRRREPRGGRPVDRRVVAADVRPGAGDVAADAAPCARHRPEGEPHEAPARDQREGGLAALTPRSTACARASKTSDGGGAGRCTDAGTRRAPRPMPCGGRRRASSA